MTPVVNVSKVQTDMSYKGNLQTLTKLSMRHQVCPGETCHTNISVSTITTLMFRGRSNCRVTYYMNCLMVLWYSCILAPPCGTYRELLFYAKMELFCFGHVTTQHVCWKKCFIE